MEETISLFSNKNKNILKYKMIKQVDVCCGLSWGDEAKGKIVAQLAKSKKYDFVCRWGGGNNAGHTVYVNKKQYKTHIVPCGIFFSVNCIIGPDCVVNQKGFEDELKYLKKNGFDTDLIKISPDAHVVTEEHIQADIKNYKGTTARGIAPCYGDKYARKGLKVKEVEYFRKYLWNGELYGNVLCEGAQGFWLDINHGNYPYNTSSITLPYGACSLGFPPQYIKTVFGACKIYDTRSGIDPEFPETLIEDPELALIVKEGQEIGTTTGRKRKVNWLNVDKLIFAINVSGTTDLVISKIDVLSKINKFKIICKCEIIVFESLNELQRYIINYVQTNCKLVKNIIFSNDKETVEGL